MTPRTPERLTVNDFQAQTAGLTVSDDCPCCGAAWPQCRGECVAHDRGDGLPGPCHDEATCPECEEGRTVHANLEKQFRQLEVARSVYEVALRTFRNRYHLLFDALAIELGYDRALLAAQLGFSPVPRGGNAVMNGEADASNEDVAKLLDRWLEHQRTRGVSDAAEK